MIELVILFKIFKFKTVHETRAVKILVTLTLDEILKYTFPTHNFTEISYIFVSHRFPLYFSYAITHFRITFQNK